MPTTTTTPCPSHPCCYSTLCVWGYSGEKTSVDGEYSYHSLFNDRPLYYKAGIDPDFVARYVWFNGYNWELTEDAGIISEGPSTLCPLDGDWPNLNIFEGGCVTCGGSRSVDSDASYLTGTFEQQTGYFSYSLELIPSYSTGSFSISLFNSSLFPTNRISIFGVSGKIFDQEDNYLHTYSANDLFTLSGNVFTGHHNIFIDGTPKNLLCCRETGSLSGVIITSGNFDYVSLNVRS